MTVRTIKHVFVNNVLVFLGWALAVVAVVSTAGVGLPQLLLLGAALIAAFVGVTRLTLRSARASVFALNGSPPRGHSHSLM